MKLTVFILRRKGQTAKQPRVYPRAEFDLSREGAALCFADGALVASMDRARIAFVSADGFMVEGVEAVTSDRYALQEWWCSDRRESTP